MATGDGPSLGFSLVSKTLMDLPNEVLVQILSHMDARSILYLRTLCRRLWALTSDSINWSTISWKSNNRFKDADGLKLALKMSRGVLKEFCHDYNNRLYKCIDDITACHSLQSVSLENKMICSESRKVGYTSKEMRKLVSLPHLTYLHLGEIRPLLFKVLVENGRHLKTLSIGMRQAFSMIYWWSYYAKCVPPDLRVAVCDSFMRDGACVRSILTFPPSENHNAYLSLYTDAHNVQVWFTPCPRIPSLENYKGIVLSADAPGLDNSSACVAEYYINDAGGDIDIEFRDIYATLTVLRLHLDKLNQFVEMVSMLPNLVHLDLQGSDNVLTDLAGLDTVSRCCRKLKVLSLFGITHQTIESVDKLWRILAKMSNLKVLVIDYSLIVDPVPMPGLTAINVCGHW